VTSKYLAACSGAVCVWLALTLAAEAQRSYAINLDQAQGLNAGEIAALAQDRSGYIWIGASGGLLRYDGSRFVRWGEPQIQTLVRQIEASDTGEVIALTEAGEAFEVTREGVTPLPGPTGHPIVALRSASFDKRNNLWTIIGNRLWVRTPRGVWNMVPDKAFDGALPVRLSRVRQGVGLVTDKAAWVFRDPSYPGQRLMSASGLFSVSETIPGQYWISDHVGAGLWRKDSEGLKPFGRPRGRLMSTAARDGTLWVSIDRYLFSIDHDGRKRIQGLREGISSGGPLLVDRDGVLWLGTFVGITRFPEPDTIQWTEEDGLPSSHVHDVVQAGGDVWAITWQGAARLKNADIYAAPVREVDIDGNICADGRDGAWMVSAGRLLHWRAGIYAEAGKDSMSQNSAITNCVTITGARSVLAATTGVYLAPTGGGDVRKVIAGLHGRIGLNAVWLGRDQQIWLADEKEACNLRLDDFLRDVADHLDSCTALPPSTGMSAGVEVGPGVEWLPLSTGLVEIRHRRVRRLAGNVALPGTGIQGLRTSPSGGYWATGPGALLRIAPCGACKDGWRLLEAPGTGQALPGNSAVDVFEDAQANIWVAGNRGLFRVPAAARMQPTRPKQLVLVSASIDGRPVDLSRSVRVGPDQHRLELNFSALYFRDPGRLVYRYRMDTDAPWSEPVRESALQLIDQSPGNYVAQMQASLDGQSWTAPASLRFSVLPPVWRSWPAILGYLLTAILLLVLAYRLRVRHLLSLQRQRLSIARDLHDELGSSLGSIVALSGVLGNPATNQSDRSRLADQLVSTAQMAGAGLRSLVWTMRDQTVDAKTFGQEIAEQARRLATRPPPALKLTLPAEDGEAMFDAQLRRQVLMIVLEAVHNAVRHAGATTIAITFDGHNAGWRLMIADDGGGFDVNASRLGAGLDSMQWRAKEMGGRLDVESNPGKGTCIVLEFSTRSHRQARTSDRSRSRARERDRG
jgi:ligand-binding sensor domain-containing protein